MPSGEPISKWVWPLSEGDSPWRESFLEGRQRCPANAAADNSTQRLAGGSTVSAAFDAGWSPCYNASVAQIRNGRLPGLLEKLSSTRPRWWNW